MSYTFKPNSTPQNLQSISSNPTNRFIEDSYLPAPTISQSLEEIITINETHSETVSNIVGLGTEIPPDSVKPDLYSTNIPLKKDVYSCKGAREELDEEFTEFNISNTNYKKFFDLHDRYFYGITRSYHQEFLDKSTQYIGGFTNPRMIEINRLRSEANQIQDQIDSIEKLHPYIKNGNVIALLQYKSPTGISNAINENKTYYMQSGKLRPILNPSVYKSLKNQLGVNADPQTNQVNDLTFVYFLDDFLGIDNGPPIYTFNDIYETPPGSFTDDIILYLNRYVSTSMLFNDDIESNNQQNNRNYLY